MRTPEVPEAGAVGSEPAGATRPWHVPLPRRARRVTSDQVRGAGLNARIAQRVTAAVGTMYAFYVLALFMAGWILWQSALTSKPFDPYPFAFLLFLGNIVQLLLMPLIMVGQNVQSAHADARAEADFEVNLKAEQEIEKLLQGLREVDLRTLEIVRRLEALELARTTGSSAPGAGSSGASGPAQAG
ncbi:MAG: DUF1003 domain-containing protein [Chloroflexota bacterium]